MNEYSSLDFLAECDLHDIFLKFDYARSLAKRFGLELTIERCKPSPHSYKWYFNYHLKQENECILSTDHWGTVVKQIKIFEKIADYTGKQAIDNHAENMKKEIRQEIADSLIESDQL